MFASSLNTGKKMLIEPIMVSLTPETHRYRKAHFADLSCVCSLRAQPGGSCDRAL